MVPKPKRKISKATIYEAIKRDGNCMVGMLTHGKYGACSSGLDPHHIKTVGSGGGDELKNLICLCRYHHGMAQERKISADELQQLLADYYGYPY